MEIKREIRNSELKFRKFIGISDEEWDTFDPDDPNMENAHNQKPMSFSNEKILHHINMTTYLSKMVVMKKEMLNIYEYSTKQFQAFSEYHRSGNPSPEEIQKEQLLRRLQILNDSLK